MFRVIFLRKISVFKIVSSSFKLFQVASSVITSGQQPACHPVIVIVFDKQSWYTIQYLIATN